MKISFFAIDECISKNIISLTGILIPIEQYDPLRQAIYKYTLGLLPGNTKILNPPELHGSELLKEYDWATDDVKLDQLGASLSAQKWHRLASA